ncbi:MAG: bifunctional DNA primase/polymerase [Actinophytocola sp.]|uniref:bifunctional DNA primase/polymerase n=1 Tax=Actinophytocola sp. TaxID=1872138 RepID=UPI003C732C15
MMIERDRSVRLMHPMPGLRWTEFRDAAADCASHGWPVLPGTYQLDGDTTWYGKPGAIGLEPAAAMWAMASTTDTAVALAWWTRRPYSVLVACGTAVDVIEVSADHGRRSWARLAERGDLGPIVGTPFGRWLVLVRPGGELRDELAADARLRARGEWVPVPPTARAGAAYRWIVHPTECSWTLPDPQRVQESLIDGLAAPGATSKSGANPAGEASDVD